MTAVASSNGSRLEADGLQKTYGMRRVVKNVHLSVNSGEVVGLLGPNGAGKTTSFYMIVGLVRADAGEIRLDGQPVQRLPIHQRARLGLSYLPQEASIFRKLTVEENIRAVLELQHDEQGRSLNKTRIEELLNGLLHELSIEKLRHSPAPALSGGERRRVEIARALATQPRFILLDEPFAGVDPIAVLEIQRIIGFLKARGIGVLITDHNVRETLGICDRAYIISEGEVLAEGTAHEIVSNADVRKVYLGEHFKNVMKPTLQVRLSQHLSLTPQLQQSIRLLQLSTLELHQEVEQMLAQNPLLEAEEEFGVSTPELAEARSNSVSEDAEGHSEASGDGEPAAEMQADDFGKTERDDWENGTERDDFDGIRETPGSSAGSSNNDDDGERSEQESPAISLAQHLQQQLAGMQLSAADRAALQVLIESLNDDGYLEDSLEDIAASLADDEDSREELLDHLRIALRWLHNLEPLGIGARNLAECLTLQLRALPRCEAQIIAILICKDHLELLARRDAKKLMALTGCDDVLLREAQALIQSLEPKPGRPFAPGEAAAVVPDVIVQRAGRGFRVMLNPDVAPKLRINELYAQALRQTRGGISNSALGGQLQEARWFIRNIQQRFETILRVSQAIVERQRGFFSHGALAMKPLVLREIADELELHESTISRVTTAKYMATPHGTFELKYFFGSGLSTETGGSASSTAVRALIKQFVEAEDVVKPLSDSALAAMLEEQGIQCARRTVAKYREGLKIAPANLRKAM